MNVVATAPIPTVSTPSFPFGGAMAESRRIRFSPVFIKVSETKKFRWRRIHAVMATSKPCAQTTYHARIKTDLQSGTAKILIVPASRRFFIRSAKGAFCRNLQPDFRDLLFSGPLDALAVCCRALDDTPGLGRNVASIFSTGSVL